jgi:hypothetical protein
MIALIACQLQLLSPRKSYAFMEVPAQNSRPWNKSQRLAGQPKFLIRVRNLYIIRLHK